MPRPVGLHLVRHRISEHQERTNIAEVVLSLERHAFQPVDPVQHRCQGCVTQQRPREAHAAAHGHGDREAPPVVQLRDEVLEVDTEVRQRLRSGRRDRRSRQDSKSWTVRREADLDLVAGATSGVHWR